MIQDIAPKEYNNHYEEQLPEPQDWLLVYQKGNVLCRFSGGKISYPKVKEVTGEGLSMTYLFTISGERFFLLKSDLEGLEGYGWEKPLIFRNADPKYLGFAGITGQQLDDWYRANRFCGCCGSPMVPDHAERMVRCARCGNMVYPKICPGVITAVTDGNRLLLTKYAHRPGAVNYALVAGFTEIGETLEETVRREVMEEVGLKVKNIRYYKSQPWSFSSTLLCGFYCEVDGSTEVRLDTEELAVAQWFEREDIPLEDDGVSLTREMIHMFKTGKQ
ncbi:MAG: NAD(+) diphosphatase [Lachnospiraceae bacterium]|jgi:NTP pyrophosphohydrolases containing a Zn-finger, probably nucleic-acid-binding|nr:NAD(+) diphosphatase [Lachnospiraceae bacterium]MCI9658155.1 NAD(+) diphosphatase [Lachnospiraceae bacterium]